MIWVNRGSQGLMCIQSTLRPMDTIDFAVHQAPNSELFLTLLDQVWQSNIHTNNGPMIKRFEKEISEQFQTDKFAAVSNGTLAIEMALRTLKNRSPNKSLVLTTPFTYIATIAAIKNSGLEIYYIDIDEDDLSMSPEILKTTLESKVKVDNVLAIVPVHPFNNVAKIDLISKVANNYSIPVIFDASHAIGAKFKNKQATSFGTFSTVSFHATKTLSTIEGGGLFVNEEFYFDSIRNFRAFGFNKDGEFELLGTNGKMSELHAIHGLTSLVNFKRNVEIRKQIFHTFFMSLNSENYSAIQIASHTESNYGYFPIISKNKETRETLEKKLVHSKIGFRRYFYPSLDILVPGNGVTQNSKKIADTILCFPFRANLNSDEIERIQYLLESI